MSVDHRTAVEKIMHPSLRKEGVDALQFAALCNALDATAVDGERWLRGAEAFIASWSGGGQTEQAYLDALNVADPSGESVQNGIDALGRLAKRMEFLSTLSNGWALGETKPTSEVSAAKTRTDDSYEHNDMHDTTSAVPMEDNAVFAEDPLDRLDWMELGLNQQPTQPNQSLDHGGSSRSEAQMLRELAQKTAWHLRRRGIKPTRFGDGKGTFVPVWDLGIYFNSYKEEGSVPGGYREFYKYDQLLLKVDGTFYVRSCYGETIYGENRNNQQSGDFNFRTTSEHDLVGRPDLSASQIIAAMDKLTKEL